MEKSRDDSFITVTVENAELYALLLAIEFTMHAFTHLVPPIERDGRMMNGLYALKHRLHSIIERVEKDLVKNPGMNARGLSLTRQD